ncbi:MAG: hypothetical protein C4519_18885 [Desulfobacteraceae bacterium]|nr:MAG: hypothetical protein C4519_18885 [Desulfobacteraceae bacterium]
MKHLANRAQMKKPRSIYIVCNGYKGRPRKPLAVCRICRRRLACSSFQDYLQPSLPFRFKAG